MFERRKLLNHYGVLIGLKRRFFETNKSYYNRIRERFEKMSEPILTRTRQGLIKALEESGFILNNFEIKEDFEKQKIIAIIEIL